MLSDICCYKSLLAALSGFDACRLVKGITISSAAEQMNATPAATAEDRMLNVTAEDRMLTVAVQLFDVSIFRPGCRLMSVGVLLSLFPGYAQ